MFHGRKKEPQKEISEEEKAAAEAKLAKIMAVNKQMLLKRANKEYDQASLVQTEKFSFLSPDFSTLWNYRREILLHLFKESKDEYATLEGKLGVIKKELEFLFKGIARSPKSYSLWYHRQWIIEQGLELEKEAMALMIAKLKEAKEKAQAEIVEASGDSKGTEKVEEKDESQKDKSAKDMHKSKILEMELMLCTKMLQRDERNFHCWNYRLWVTELYIKEIGKRADPSIARSK